MLRFCQIIQGCRRLQSLTRSLQIHKYHHPRLSLRYLKMRKRTIAMGILIVAAAFAVFFVLSTLGHTALATSASSHLGVSTNSMGHKGNPTLAGNGQLGAVSRTSGKSSITINSHSHNGACPRCLFA